MKNMKFKGGDTIPVGTIVYKKVHATDALGRHINVVLTMIATKPGICTLNPWGQKCRVAEALVIKAETTSGRPVTSTTFDSPLYRGKKYKLYSKYTPDKFDSNTYDMCSNGVNCFLTKTQARNFNL